MCYILPVTLFCRNIGALPSSNLEGIAIHHRLCAGGDLISELLANILATPAMYKKGQLKAVTMDRLLISSPLCTRLPQPCVTPATIMQTASSQRQWEEKKQQQESSSRGVIESAYEGNGAALRRWLWRLHKLFVGMKLCPLVSDVCCVDC